MASRLKEKWRRLKRQATVATILTSIPFDMAYQLQAFMVHVHVPGVSNGNETDEHTEVGRYLDHQPV
jgi:hypothetical protein